jgi:hypothetical protein
MAFVKFIAKILVAASLSFALYWVVVVALDALLSMLPAGGAMRNTIGVLWAALQPLLIGPAFLLIAALIFYWLVGRWQARCRLSKVRTSHDQRST